MKFFGLFPIFLIVVVIDFGVCQAMNLSETITIVGPIGKSKGRTFLSYWFNINDKGESITCTKNKENGSYYASKSYRVDHDDFKEVPEGIPQCIDKRPDFVPERIKIGEDDFNFIESKYKEQKNKK
jgi:hypothetical protein